MQELSIRRALDENTQKQSVWIYADGNPQVFALHITGKGEVIITDHADYTKIYSIQTLEYFNMLAQAETN